eukprot:9405998-Lingulodinium_polyedra.AAC.1
MGATAWRALHRRHSKTHCGLQEQAAGAGTDKAVEAYLRNGTVAGHRVTQCCLAGPRRGVDRTLQSGQGIGAHA